MAAVLACDRHGRHVGVAVAEVDHVGERDRPGALGHVLVDALAQILHALVDAEQVLRLAGVGDDALGVGQVVGLEPVFRGEHVVEATVDRGALDDLGQARRDQVVAQHHAVALRVLLDVGADGVEPGLHARIHLDVLALRDQVAAVDADVLLLGLLVEQVHVGDERIGGVLLGQAVALGPEGFRIGVDLGQEGIFLHRLGRERAVEIVDQGDGLLVELGRAGTTRIGAGLGVGLLVVAVGTTFAAAALDHGTLLDLLQAPLSADSGDRRKAVRPSRPARGRKSEVAGPRFSPSSRAAPGRQRQRQAKAQLPPRARQFVSHSAQPAVEISARSPRSWR